MCMGVNTNTPWSDLAKERAALSIWLEGMGLRGAADRRFSQFIGGAVQSIIPLLTRKDKHNNTSEGRLNILYIANLFGEGSFDFPYNYP